MSVIKIVVVDDHSMVATGMCSELEKESDFEVVKVVTDPELLMDTVSVYSPDLVLMDIRMGQYNGLLLTKGLKAQYSHLKIILMSGYNISHLAKDSGADAFTSKEEPISALVRTIRKVCFDEVSIFPREANPSNPLTKTEIVVLQLISEDHTRKEIAAKLFISEKTVTNHISSILEKLEARSRVGAIVRGAELGLISLMVK